MAANMAAKQKATPKTAAERTATHTATCWAVRDYIFAMGGWCKKMIGGLGVRRGLADIDGFITHPVHRLPVAFYIEVKTGGGELSKDQRDIRDEIVGRGGFYIEAHSVDEVEDAFYAKGLVPKRLLR